MLSIHYRLASYDMTTGTQSSVLWSSKEGSGKWKKIVLVIVPDTLLIQNVTLPDVLSIIIIKHIYNSPVVNCLGYTIVLNPAATNLITTIGP